MVKQIMVDGTLLGEKRHELTTWMNLNNITLSERSQTQTDNVPCDSMYMKLWKRQNSGERKQTFDCQVVGVY